MTQNYKIYDNTKEAWRGMLEAIILAEKSIFWEMYTLVDDDIGNNFFDILKQKASAGVDVKMIVDYWGSFWLSKKKVEELRNSGIEVLIFRERKNKLRGMLYGFNRRNHRKIMLVDEKVGFIGGVNIDKRSRDWFDIQIAVYGSQVYHLLWFFAKSYIRNGGKKKNVRHLFQYFNHFKKNKTDFVYEHGQRTKSLVKNIYKKALLRAREKVVLFSPYYYPDLDLIKTMREARKRGIKIELLIPMRTDVKIATYVNYAWFNLMEKLGIDIYVTKKMMHGKGVIVDDDWAMVGSSNINNISFYDSDEANLQFFDKKIIGKLKRVIDRWRFHSDLLKNTMWHKRSKLQKIVEWCAMKIYKFWYKLK